MENEIKQHFDSFYNRLVFLDSPLGEEEQTFRKTFYWTTKEEKTGKLVKSFVFEETLNDERIFIRNKGLVLTLVYGTWHNKKYRSIEAYIDKDPYYKEKEKGSVDELLTLLDVYIATHYKEFYEKINKVIYGERYEKDIPMKYRPANILSIEFLKRFEIRNATITNKDIEHLKKYVNLRELNIQYSNIKANNFGSIPFSLLMISNSEIDSMLCLDHIISQSLTIYKCKFKSNIPRAITIDTNSLNIDEIKNINIADFFLSTNFKNVTKASFQNIELTPLEVNLLSVLHRVVELEAWGKSTSYHFLNELPELEYFRGFIELIDEERLNKVSENYKGKLEKYEIKEKGKINQYIFYQLTDALVKHKKFWNEIHLSKLALEKYKGIIRTSQDETIKHILALPLSTRKNLGKEKEIQFVDNVGIDPFHLLLANTNEKYLSQIVGRDGERFIKPLRVGYTDMYHILGPNGKIVACIEKTEARDVTVPEHYEEVRNDIVENENNIFDYYYNRTFNEPTKLSFLSKKIIDIYYMSNKNFKEALDKNRELIKKKEELEQVENGLLKANLSILSLCPRHQLVEKEKIRKGKVVCYLEYLPDDFIEEDNNLYQALKRTKNPAILNYSLSEIWEEKNIKKEKQEEIKKDIEKLLEIWDRIEKVEEKIIEEDILVTSYVEEKYKEITQKIKACDYPHWFLLDIEEFLSQFALNEEDYIILYHYILILQCRKKYNFQKELHDLEEREFILREYYSIDSLISYTEGFTDFIDFETSLKKGTLSKKDYTLITEFFAILSKKEEIKNSLDINKEARIKAYQKMMPLIDNLNVQQLCEIKHNMIKTNENKKKFTKFVDYLYYYFYQEMPPWIKLELAKCPHVKEKYEKTVTQKLIKEKTFHIEEGVKIDRGIFSFL